MIKDSGIVYSLHAFQHISIAQMYKININDYERADACKTKKRGLLFCDQAGKVRAIRCNILDARKNGVKGCYKGYPRGKHG